MLGALDTVPASVSAPHLMDMAVSSVEPGDYLVRAIGVDSILNLVLMQYLRRFGLLLRKRMWLKFLN